MCCLDDPFHLTQAFIAKDGMDLKSRGVPPVLKIGNKLL